MINAVEKLKRRSDTPDFNSFVYATASVISIRRALFPLDAQVEIKVLAKIQVIFYGLVAMLYGFFHLFTHSQVLLRKIPTISELWRRLSGKKEKLFPDDFQEAMCKLGLNLSKMEVYLRFDLNYCLIYVQDSIVFLLMGSRRRWISFRGRIGADDASRPH